MAQTLSALGAVSCCIAALTTAAVAEAPRQTLGLTQLFSNDALFGREDRWRSGAYSASLFRGPDWTGTLPSQPFTVMQYRFRGEAISPDNLSNPAPGDRLYAGTWWLGAYTHFDWQGFEVAAGADIAITGEQSGIRSLQSSIHDVLSMPRVGLETYQVDDGVYLNGSVEIAQSLRWQGGGARPFLEVQGGVETLVRAGVDLTFGGLGRGGLRVRDPITGQRIPGITDIENEGGWSFLLGADSAWVESSVFLPEDRGFAVEETRNRARLGVNYGFGQHNVFYGVTWLSEEFVGQPEGQTVGSFSFDLRF